MHPHFKFISTTLLRAVLKKEGNPVDPNDPYQCFLYLWAKFVCFECDRELTFGYPEAATFPASEIKPAPDLARNEGWQLEPPSIPSSLPLPTVPNALGSTLPEPLHAPRSSRTFLNALQSELLTARLKHGHRRWL